MNQQEKWDSEIGPGSANTTEPSPPLPKLLETCCPRVRGMADEDIEIKSFAPDACKQVPRTPGGNDRIRRADEDVLGVRDRVRRADPEFTAELATFGGTSDEAVPVLGRPSTRPWSPGFLDADENEALLLELPLKRGNAATGLKPCSFGSPQLPKIKAENIGSGCPNLPGGGCRFRGTFGRPMGRIGRGNSVWEEDRGAADLDLTRRSKGRVSMGLFWRKFLKKKPAGIGSMRPR